MSFADRFAGFDRPMVIALSGGCDSAVAAWAACQGEAPVRCVHVDHGLTGSPRMRRAAVAIAEHLDLVLTVAEVDPDSASETDLRDARYQALLASLEPAEILVTAHNADDLVETVLINLLRGTGLTGLSGIPATRGVIVRPLLDVPSSELRKQADHLGLPFTDDPENASADHLRNRIRHELLPLLETGYQPSVRTAITRTAQHLTESSEILNASVSRVPLERSPAGVRAPLGRLAAVPEPIRREVFREMLTSVRPPYTPSRAEVDRVASTFSQGVATDLESTDARCTIDGPWLMIAEPVEVPTEQIMLEDGAVWGAFRFSFRVGLDPVSMSLWRFRTDEAGLVVRGVRPTDTIAMRSGSKSARSAISERGFDPDTHAVVADMEGQIAWIPGVRHRWTQVSAKGYLVVFADRDQTWAPFER